jgi:hypothetical protein
MSVYKNFLRFSLENILKYNKKKFFLILFEFCYTDIGIRSNILLRNIRNRLLID